MKLKVKTLKALCIP